MGFALDFSGDQTALDNLEPVTFTSARIAGDVTVTVEDATIDWVSLREAAASNGAYQIGDTKFTVRRSALADLGGAKVADRVTRADGSVWTVLSAAPPGIEGVWNLTTRNLTLANDLRGTGTLSRPVTAQTAAGRSAKTSYTDVAANIPCRVQPEGGTAADSLGQRTMPKRYTAYLGQQVDARASDRFVCAGVTYTVLEVRQPERIDQLMSLGLERIDP